MRPYIPYAAIGFAIALAWDSTEPWIVGLHVLGIAMWSWVAGSDHEIRRMKRTIKTLQRWREEEDR